MKKSKKELTTLKKSAQKGFSIDAEKEAAVSTPQTGEEESLAAGGTRDKDAEFSALIENEYKEQFSQKVQKILKGRLREVKAMKETSDKNAQLIASLMEKMGITDGDTDKLGKMIDERISVEKDSEKEKKDAVLKRLIAENALLKRGRDEDKRKMEVESRVNLLNEQAEEAKSAYEDFDLKKALENPEFIRLIKAGVSVKTAHEVVNLSAILDSNAKNAEKKVVSAIRAKSVRPVENGSDLSGGILISGNVSRLTKKQRAELAKRAAKGEKIEF